MSSHLDIDALALPNYLMQEQSRGREVFTHWGEGNDTRIVAAFKYTIDGRSGRSGTDYNVVLVYRNKFGTEWTRLIAAGVKVRVLLTPARRTDEAITRLRREITGASQSVIGLTLKAALREDCDTIQVLLNQERAAR